MRDTALEYMTAGLCVLPASKAEKRPMVPWKNYQHRQPSSTEICSWFPALGDGVCLVAGATSGNLEMIDFDAGGLLFDDWVAKIPEHLFKRLVVEHSQSGGFHVIYRCTDPVNGNTKLARGTPPGKDKPQTLIETRGDGGIFLCHPTAGYELKQGSLTALPVLSQEEREQLLVAAWELDEQPEVQPEPAPVKGVTLAGEIRPGDDYNARGDYAALLTAHGWTHVKQNGDNDHWCRPGKAHGTSATVRMMSGAPVFYCFSSNAAPFEPGKAYSLFTVYAMLEHNGDHATAASALRHAGYGSQPQTAQDPEVDLSGLTAARTVPAQPAAPEEPSLPADDVVPDPGPIPENLLNVPGFISQVMEVTLSTAPYPNRVLAFAGALVLQGFLAGRKVRDSMDNRTNVYVLALADSGTGKDYPRRINARILADIGRIECLGESIASGEGLADALQAHPCMLFQPDEIDGLINMVNSKTRDARYEFLMQELMKFYTSATSVYPMRARAGRDPGPAIDQPCLCLMGSAIPRCFYGALSNKMLENGFFSRMLVLEAGPRSSGQDSQIFDLPAHVIAVAKWWVEQPYGPGDLAEAHPEPKVVAYTGQARDLRKDYQRYCDKQYDEARGRQDQAGMAIWARAFEKTAKLALLYAISSNHKDPCISDEAVDWAFNLVDHLTKRMLFMASEHVADSTFESNCLKVTRSLRNAPEREMQHSNLLRRSKLTAKEFEALIQTLAQRGDVLTETRKSARFYRLRV